MDRVFTHLRFVRCQTCLRVFCCADHRVEHEICAHAGRDYPAAGEVIRRRFRSAVRRTDPTATAPEATGDALIVPTAPLFRRRFRSAACAPEYGLAVNCRKRRHVDALTACAAQSIAEGLRARSDRPGSAGYCTPPRAVLKAARRTGPPAEICRQARGQSSPAEICSPERGQSLAVVVSHAFATPATDCSAPSLYQTPMWTPVKRMSTKQNTPDLLTDLSSGLSPDASTVPLPDLSVTASFNTPTGRDRSVYRSAKKVSLGENSTQKGFFWTNMARRFRLALRPARPRSRASIGLPSPSVRFGTVADVATFYGNIHPRRPIHKDDASATPVRARPTLEELRQAHDEAVIAVDNGVASSEAADTNETGV